MSCRSETDLRRAFLGYGAADVTGGDVFAQGAFALTGPQAHIYIAAIPALGAVAQLGERGVRNAEVRGSIPLCSTKIRQ